MRIQKAESPRRGDVGNQKTRTDERPTTVNVSQDDTKSNGNGHGHGGAVHNGHGEPDGNTTGGFPIDLVLSRLDCKRSGKGYKAKCPAHEDTNPSLSVTATDDGKVLLHCHAGCSKNEVLAAMQLTDRDLFPRKKGPRKATSSRIVATYEYKDESGTLLYRKLRYAPKTFAFQRPDGKGGWIDNIEGTRRVLYGMPDLEKAETVDIVEGEKDADTLRDLGRVATCNDTGAGKWRDEYSPCLKGKHVVIFADNDKAGENHALQVARSVFPVAASLKIVRFPDLPAKGDVTDWRKQGHGKEDLLPLIEAAQVWTQADQDRSAKTDGFTRSEIRVTTRITEVVDKAQDALIALPDGPHVFQRIDQLCFVTHNAVAPQWLKRPIGAPAIAFCSPAQLRERMSRAAEWFKWVARSKEWVLTLPPEWAVETLHGRREWLFPVLADVISSPTLREDGEIISAPGYDPDTGLFLDTQGVIFPPIPTRPTLDEARRAVEALTEPFADFPFAGPYGLSAALSAIPSLVARPAINGCVPLFAVDSTTRGAGKGLLIDVACTIATSRPAPRWAQTQDEEEDRKALLTIGMEGDACVHIDNLTHALGSGPLDSALTARVVKGRLLGLNKSAEVPMNCVFFASGNNISYAGDMARRVVPIHLESLLERPEDREDFQQPRLLDWVSKERPRLVVEALTLLKAYFVAGCPKQGIPAYGSFEEWSDLVRSALIWAGCADPCEGRALLEAASDPGYENLARLLHCWAACYESKAVTLSRPKPNIAVMRGKVVAGVRPPGF